MTMTHSTVDVVLNPSDETFQLGPLAIRFLVTGDDTGGSAAVFEFTVPGGEMLRAPSHSHDAFEETIYGLEGVLTWTVDGRPIEVAPGQALTIARGAVHRFDNLGQEDARVLVIASPALFGPEYFREMAAAVADAVGGHPDQAKMVEIMLRHGLTPAPPPPVA
jgi:quercetin dioxygenase-like cupin family protein